MKERGPLLQAAILANHENGEGELCEADLEAIKSWTFELTMGDESQLTESGKNEQKTLAERYKQRIPGLLGGRYEKDGFTVI